MEKKKLHNDGLLDLNSSQNIVRVTKSMKIRCMGHVALMGKMRNAYVIVVRKGEEKRHLERPWLRWEYNIKVGGEEKNGKRWTRFFERTTGISGGLL